jgi:hypothetical protein
MIEQENIPESGGRQFTVFDFLIQASSIVGGFKIGYHTYKLTNEMFFGLTYEWLHLLLPVLIFLLVFFIVWSIFFNFGFMTFFYLIKILKIDDSFSVFKASIAYVTPVILIIIATYLITAIA